ncbi:MAG: nuclear transport factor 2 family protein [Pedobacter sp.]
MKYAPVILIVFFLYGTLVANAQASKTEIEIRRLEKAQCDAIVQHDSVALYKLWADDFTVNSPTNDVVKLEAAKYAIRNGFIDYSLFESNLEDIMIFKDMVITMGSETIKPIRNAPMAGQTVNRRYTQVWMKRKGEWKLIARHANIIRP